MKERNSNIEILRILAMMSVVALHYVHQDLGGVEVLASFPNSTWFFVAAVRGFALPMVNTFVLITGYFTITSNRLNVRKMINLLLIVIYYGVINYIYGLIVTKTVSLSLNSFCQSVFPFFYGGAWFIKTYIVLSLLSPFINQAVNRISRENYRLLLIIQVLLFSVWYSFGHSAPIVDDGYGIINFVTLYLIGGYIRLHIKENRLLNHLTYIGCILFFIAFSCITALASVFVNPFGYSYFTNVVGSVMAFLAAVKIPVRSNRFVNTLSVNAFDVYFVHNHVFGFLMIDRVAGTLAVIPHILFSMIVCYLAGYLCGLLRKMIFTYTIDKLLDKSIAVNKTFVIN